MRNFSVIETYCFLVIHFRDLLKKYLKGYKKLQSDNKEVYIAVRI
jgi:hypothetical protein